MVVWPSHYLIFKKFASTCLLSEDVTNQVRPTVPGPVVFSTRVFVDPLSTVSYKVEPL